MPEETEKDLSVDDEQGEEIAGGLKRARLEEGALELEAEKEL